MKILKNGGGVIVGGIAERDRDIKIFDYYIGIDPDVDKSGFAIYSKKRKELDRVSSLDFFELLRTLQNIKKASRPKQDIIFTFCVHIEGGWLVQKSNFHSSEKKGFHTIKESRVAQRISKNVGENHSVGKLIVKMLIDLDISFTVRPPITPKFADESFFKIATKWQGPTNVDSRSAANYCFGY